MTPSKEKSAIYSEKLIASPDKEDLEEGEYGPQHLLEEPNIWNQKGLFMLLLWTYVMQGTVHAVNEAAKKVMTFETKYCDVDREIDDMMELTKWPVLLKLVVAPIVDYLKPFGLVRFHRRSWLICCQAFSSLFMILIVLNWDNIIFLEEEKCPDASLLVWLLMPMLFFTAVGDVALDGLAIVAMAGPNIAYAGVAGSFGPRFGRRTLVPILIGVSKNEKSGFEAGLCAIAVANLLTCYAVLRIPETAMKSKPASGLLGAYKKMYRLLRNKRTLALCFIAATWHMGLGNIIGSTRDERHRGWTKDDMQAQGYITMVPNVVFFYIVSVYTARLDPMGKMPMGLVFFFLGSLLELSTWFFVPYVKREKDSGFDLSCMKSWLSENSNGCESWVFPFRVGLDISAMPFEYMFEQILGAQTSRMAPIPLAGTFTSLLNTAAEVGEIGASNVENDMRMYFDETLRKYRCNGDLEYFGKDTFIENNKTYRYCGHDIPCRIDPPVDGETGLCNQYADGYNVAVFLSLGLFVCWGTFLYFTFAKFVNVDKEKYDPDNEEEMIRCTCCRKRKLSQEENELSTTTSYVALE